MKTKGDRKILEDGRAIRWHLLWRWRECSHVCSGRKVYCYTCVRVNMHTRLPFGHSRTLLTCDDYWRLSWWTSVLLRCCDVNSILITHIVKVLNIPSGKVCRIQWRSGEHKWNAAGRLGCDLRGSVVPLSWEHIGQQLILLHFRLMVGVRGAINV